MISNASGTDPLRYLVGKAQEQERAAYNAGDLVTLCVWAPGLHTTASMLAFHAKCRTNSHHFVAWAGSPDDIITGNVRPEDLRFWLDEFCEITNSVVWGQTDLFQRYGYKEETECRLPDGTRVTRNQLAKWLDSSVAEGWAVCVSYICSKDTRLLVGSRKSRRPEAQPDATPNDAAPHL
jgi:hypothetical protein